MAERAATQELQRKLWLFQAHLDLLISQSDPVRAQWWIHEMKSLFTGFHHHKHRCNPPHWLGSEANTAVLSESGATPVHHYMLLVQAVRDAPQSLSIGCAAVDKQAFLSNGNLRDTSTNGSIHALQLLVPAYWNDRHTRLLISVCALGAMEYTKGSNERTHVHIGSDCSREDTPKALLASWGSLFDSKEVGGDLTKYKGGKFGELLVEILEQCASVTDWERRIQLFCVLCGERLEAAYAARKSSTIPDPALAVDRMLRHHQRITARQERGLSDVSSSDDEPPAAAPSHLKCRPSPRSKPRKAKPKRAPSPTPAATALVEGITDLAAQELFDGDSDESQLSDDDSGYDATVDESGSEAEDQQGTATGPTPNVDVDADGWQIVGATSHAARSTTSSGVVHSDIPIGTRRADHHETVSTRTAIWPIDELKAALHQVPCVRGL